MNVTLIGMAGAGKSTVGKVLAQRLHYEFIDIDKEIEGQYKKPLQEILNNIGENRFIELEEKIVIGLGERDKLVISPGGSIVYSPIAMEYLRAHSKIVFLDTVFEKIEKRINIASRGLVGKGTKTLRELYDERRPLYKKYAHYTVAPVERSPEKIANNIFLFYSTDMVTLRNRERFLLWFIVIALAVLAGLLLFNPCRSLFW